MRNRGPFGRKAKLPIQLPLETDLVALSSELRQFGPEFALPNKMPQKWLLSIARDLIVTRVLEQDQSSDREELGIRIQSSLLMIFSILAEQGRHNDTCLREGEYSVSEKQITEFLWAYQHLVFEEIAARATGVKAVSYDIGSIF